MRSNAFTARCLAQIHAALAAAEQNVAISQQNATAVSLRGSADVEARVAMLRNLLDRTQGEVAQAAQPNTTMQPSAPSGAQQPAQVAKIDLGGRVSQVRVAESASTANLTAVMREFAGAAGRAS